MFTRLMSSPAAPRDTGPAVSETEDFGTDVDIGYVPPVSTSPSPNLDGLAAEIASLGGEGVGGEGEGACTPAAVASGSVPAETSTKSTGEKRREFDAIFCVHCEFESDEENAHSKIKNTRRLLRSLSVMNVSRLVPPQGEKVRPSCTGCGVVKSVSSTSNESLASTASQPFSSTSDCQRKDNATSCSCLDFCATTRLSSDLNSAFITIGQPTKDLQPEAELSNELRSSNFSKVSKMDQGSSASSERRACLPAPVATRSFSTRATPMNVIEHYPHSTVDQSDSDWPDTDGSNSGGVSKNRGDSSIMPKNGGGRDINKSGSKEKLKGDLQEVVDSWQQGGENNSKKDVKESEIKNKYTPQKTEYVNIFSGGGKDESYKLGSDLLVNSYPSNRSGDDDDSSSDETLRRPLADDESFSSGPISSIGSEDTESRPQCRVTCVSLNDARKQMTPSDKSSQLRGGTAAAGGGLEACQRRLHFNQQQREERGLDANDSENPSDDGSLTSISPSADHQSRETRFITVERDKVMKKLKKAGLPILEGNCSIYKILQEIKRLWLTPLLSTVVGVRANRDAVTGESNRGAIDDFCLCLGRIAKERDAAIAERDAAIAEARRVTEQMSSFQDYSVPSAAERQITVSNWQHDRDQLSRVNIELTLTQEQLRVVTAKLNSQCSDLNAATVRLNATSAQLETAIADRDAANAQRDAIAENYASAVKEIECIRCQLDNARGVRDALEVETRCQRERLTRSTEERDAAVAELKEAEATIKKNIIEAVYEIQMAHAKLKKTLNERDELQNRLDEAERVEYNVENLMSAVSKELLAQRACLEGIRSGIRIRRPESASCTAPTGSRSRGLGLDSVTGNRGQEGCDGTGRPESRCGGESGGGDLGGRCAADEGLRNRLQRQLVAYEQQEHAVHKVLREIDHVLRTSHLVSGRSGKQPQSDGVASDNGYSEGNPDSTRCQCSTCRTLC